MTRAPALAAVLLLAAPFASAADRAFQRSFAAKPGQTLSLRTDAGSVRVEGSDAATVSVGVSISGDQRRVDGFVVAAEAGRGGVTVTGKDPVGGGGSLSADFRVKVPRRYALKVRTGGGSVRVDGVDAKAELVTGGGSIKVSGVQGPLTARTGGGSVDVAVSKGFAGVHAESGGGSIEISVPKGTAADVDASTGGGSVRCDLPVTVQGAVDPWHLKGPANGGGKELYARTGGGSIRIRASR